MKKVAPWSIPLLIPALLMPTLLFVTVSSVFLSTKVSAVEYFYDHVLQGNALLLLPILLTYSVLTLGCALLFKVICVKRQAEPLSVVKTIMVLKFITLPAYLLDMLGAVVLLITIFTIPFSFALCFFYIIVLMAFAFPTIHALKVAEKQGMIDESFALLAGMMQFVFAADVVFTVKLYLCLKRAEHPAAVE